MRLAISPTAATPTDFYSQRFWGFSFPSWSPGLYSLSHTPVVSPGLSTHKCGTAQACLPAITWPTLVCQLLTCHASSPPRLPVSTPPTSVNECFFFISLVSRLQYSSVFCQFWLCFVFKLVCYRSFGCARNWSLSTYISILAGCWINRKMIHVNSKYSWIRWGH